MTIRQVIHGGPAKANELFAKLAETGDGAVKTRERLFSELKAELELLAGLEERHLFPVLRKHPGTKALAADALADNKQVRALLAELERTPKEGPDFAGKLAELRQAFQRHVRDEKRELLPAVAKALSEEEAQAVAERIEAGKAEAEEAKREEAERQRAEAKREAAEKQRAEARREREAAEAEQARREEAERRRAEAKRESEEAEKQRAEAKREREAAEAEQARREEAERRRAEAKRESEEEAQAVAERIEAGKAEAEEAKREEAEKQRAEAKREREEAEAAQARREEAERRRAEAKREREEAERQEAEAAERRAREAAEAVTRPAEVAARGGLRAVETGRAAADAGAQIATRGSWQVMDAAGQAVQETAASVSVATRRYHAAASRVLTAEGDLAGFWLELVREQVAQNVETFRKLATTRDWREALELQSTLVRDSVGRMSRMNGRYRETVQAVMKATSSAAKDQAGNTA